MAYCRECGAYIPDGQSKCLACGYDESENAAGNTAQAYSGKTEARGNTAFDAEKLRRELEQQREKQRENSRRWAEAERARRERQEREYSANAQNTTRSTSYTRQSYDKRANGRDYSRGMGIISYLGLWIIPLLFRRDDRFAMFHAKQGLVLSLITWAATGIAAILDVGWIVTLAKLYLIYKGISNANDGKMEPLPYIGDIASKL